MTRTKTLLAALALAIPAPAVISACGDDESSEDPQQVIEDAFNNDTSIESGVVDLSFELSAEGDQGGSLTADISGPFATDPDTPGQIGQLDWDLTVSGEGAASGSLPGGDSLEAGITVTEDNLYVNYDGTDYELGEEAYQQLLEQQEEVAPETEEGASFREQCETAIEAQGGDPAACDIDITAWFSNLENEGTEDKGGAESTHVSGTLDVEQMITDLFNLGASIPGATGGVDPALLEGQLGVISEAVSGADFDVYAATEDGTLRGLDFGLDIDTAAFGGATAGVEGVSLAFALEVADVGEEQEFEVPDDPQPIEDLAQQFGGLGAIPGGSELPGLGAGSGTGGGGGASGGIDPDCVAEAAGDPDAIEKCLE